MEVTDAVVLNRHLLSVDDLYRMVEAGVLGPNARVELIDGELVDMAAIGTRHAAAVTRLNRLFSQAVGERAIVWVQNPLRLSNRNLTEPGIALLKPRDDFYAHAAPTGADALLVIEVADTSARYDRRVKAPLYARHGVPELWIVDLDARCLRLLRSPRDGQWQGVTTLDAPGQVEVQSMAGVSVDLSALL